MSSISQEINKIIIDFKIVLKIFSDGKNGNGITNVMFKPTPENELFYKSLRTLTSIRGVGLNSEELFNFFKEGYDLFEATSYSEILKLTDPNDNISRKLSQVGIGGPIYLNKLGENLDTQILKTRSSFINQKSLFEDNFAELIEIYLRTILVIYEFKTRIKDIYFFLEKSVLEESNTTLKNAKQNALNRLSPLCENTDGKSVIDNLIIKIFDSLEENKLFSNNQDDEFKIYDSQKINKQTFIEYLKESYTAYTEKYQQIVTTTKVIKQGYDAMFELKDTTSLDKTYREIIDKINERKEKAKSMLEFQVSTLGAENVVLQYTPRIFDLKIYIDKDGEIKNVIDEGYNDIRKGLAEIAEIDRIEKERVELEREEKNANLKLRREEEKKKQDERVNMWYQKTIKAAMIKYRNNYHTLELAVKNINQRIDSYDYDSKYGKTPVKLKTMKEIIAEMANNKYITRNREKQYNNLLEKPKTTILNQYGKYFRGKSAAQIAKLRDAPSTLQTVTNPKTDNFIPVIDDVTYDFSELPFNDAEFDKVEKSEFDKTKAQILGVKLGQEKKKVKELEQELKQKIDDANREYKDKMENCYQEKEKLTKSIGEIFQRFTDNSYHEIISKMEFYKNEFSTGFELNLNVDEFIDKITNEEKPSETNRQMRDNMLRMRAAKITSKRGGKKKKVGKKTRKKKNIKKTRK